MVGYPKYNYGDIVSFNFKLKNTEKETTFTGNIAVIDAWGTFEQNEEPSYDILVENAFDNEPCLFKHIRESELELK